MTDEADIYRVRNGVRAFYGVVALVPFSLFCGMGWLLLGKLDRVLAAPIVPFLSLFVVALLVAAVLARTFDQVRISGSILSVRVFRTTSFDLARDVVFWGHTSQTRQGANKTLLLFQTDTGKKVVPIAHLENWSKLVNQVEQICGPPTRVKRTREGYVFAPTVPSQE